MGLMDRLAKTGSVGMAEVMSKSKLFSEADMITTKMPALNIAMSGRIDGGLTPGLTILAGNSKTFKSALSLYAMKAYLDKYEDAIAIFYDTEFGITTEFLENFGIDPDRVLHIPIEHVEQLKFDMVKKLEAIERNEKVFFLVDSIGQISSKKEVEDAIDEKSVADMTRAKAIRSLLRLVTIQFTKKNIPCIMINHVYQEIGMFPKTIIPGGTAVTYSANQIFVISKSQEKQQSELAGWTFTINIEKSRFVREKAKLQFTVMYEEGIIEYSGLLDIALDLGFVEKPKNGWYTRPCVADDKSWRKNDTNTKDFWDPLLTNEDFKKAVETKYRLGSTSNKQTTEDIIDISDEFEEL